MVQQNPPQPPPLAQETIKQTAPLHKESDTVEKETKPSQDANQNKANSSTVVPIVQDEPKRGLDQTSKESKFTDIIVRMRKRRGFRQCKEFLAQCRREEFLVRINNFHFKNRELQPVKRAFERMKINSLSKEVQAYTQDKF